MEDIEKHIKNLKDYIRIDKENIAYDDSNFSQFCKGHIEDIQAVLDELENRISLEVVEEKLKNTFDILDEKYSADKISVFSGNTYMEKFKLLGKAEGLKELLNKE